MILRSSEFLILEELFFDLLQVAIGNKVCLSRTPSEQEWGDLYAIAKKQSLVGVCFAGVQRVVLHQQISHGQLFLQWMGMAAKIQQRNEVVNRQCVNLQKRLSNDGFWSCILKGQGNHLYYGELAPLRQSGDIDVWLDADVKSILQYVHKIAPTEEVNELHVHLDIFKIQM